MSAEKHCGNRQAPDLQGPRSSGGCVDVVTLDGGAIVGVTRPWLVLPNDVISGSGSTSLSLGLSVQFHIRNDFSFLQRDKAV